MKSKIISWAIVFTSCSLISMERSDLDTLAQNKAKLMDLISVAQRKLEPFISSGKMSAEENAVLTELTSAIEKETQTLDLLVKEIRGSHSSQNPMPKTYFNITFGALEAQVKSAHSTCNWDVCYKNKTAANFYDAITSLKSKLWQTDRLFILDPDCASTPIKWTSVTTMDYLDRITGCYHELIAECDFYGIPGIVFVKFTEDKEQRARFRYCSRTSYEENNLGRGFPPPVAPK